MNSRTPDRPHDLAVAADEDARPGIGEDYRGVAAELRTPLRAAGADAAFPFSELVRYATLAANSHNTQPWRFEEWRDEIVVEPDFRRRCPAVDQDDHHLFASLGCAVENLVIAATAFGISASPRFSDEDGRVSVSLASANVPRSRLVNAIPRRQSTRTVYGGTPLTKNERRALSAAAERPNVQMRLIEDRDRIARLRDLVIAGNTFQMEDPSFVAELRDWIRFSESAALARRDGLFAGCMGSPTVPDWIGRLGFSLVFRTAPENSKYSEQIDSSAALAVFISTEDRPANWFEIGRAFQRFALEATRLGLAHAHVNQAVEVPRVRSELARELGLTSGRPSLVIRIGRAPTLPYSLRRPVDEITA